MKTKTLTVGENMSRGNSRPGEVGMTHVGSGHRWRAKNWYTTGDDLACESECLEKPGISKSNQINCFV